MQKLLTIFGLTVAAIVAIAAYPYVQMTDGKILITNGKIQFAPSWTPISGLMAHWKMNDNAGNTTVAENISSNNGTAKQNTSTLHRSGKIDGAINFNGSSDLLTLSNGTNFPTGDRTICAWVNVATTSGVHCIHDYGTRSADQDWAFNIRDNKLEASIYANAMYGVSTAITTGTWLHVAVTYSNAIKTSVFYINSTSETPVVCSTQPATLPSDLSRIGSLIYQAEGYYHFNGNIDDLRVYNRALTSAEISAIYNDGDGTEDE